MRFLREALQILLENWTLKLTAVFLAFILWLVVRGDPAAERVITIPLEISIPRNMEITNDRPSAVDVTLRGSSTSMWVIQQMSCNIDLRSADEGDHVVPLTPDNIRLPQAAGVEVVGIRPARIPVNLEATISREVPISVATRGDPAPGYDIYSKAARPSTVLLSGPRTHVEGLNEVSTESVSLSDLKTSIRTYVNLNVKDPMVHTMPSGAVQVSIDIGVHRRSITVRRIPIVADEDGVTIRPAFVSVQLLVPADYTAPLTPADFSATVDLGNVDVSEPEIRVKPDVRFAYPVDSAIIIKEISPAEVLVRRTRK